MPVHWCDRGAAPSRPPPSVGRALQAQFSSRRCGAADAGRCTASARAWPHTRNSAAARAGGFVVCFCPIHICPTALAAPNEATFVRWFYV